MSLDGLSLTTLVKELNMRLVGGRIDKIFQPDKSTLVIWIRQPRETLKLVISIEANLPRIHLSDTVPDNPTAPPVFCMLLRKHLEDGRIGAIRQYGEDRIIILDCDVRVEQGQIVTKQLIVETMGKHSNIIFAYQDVIIDSIRRVNMYMSRHRQVLPGKPYFPPPAQDRVSLFTAFPTDIVTLATKGPVQLFKALIGVVNGMGPITAKELAWQAGLPSALLASNMDNDDKSALAQAIGELAQKLQSNEIQPTVAIGSQGELAAIAAFPIYHLTKVTLHQFATMSEAVAFASTLIGSRKPPLLEQLIKLVQTELHRLIRKQALLTSELQEAKEAAIFRYYADTLMIYLHQVPASSHEVTLPYLFSDIPDDIISIPLDPALSPIANAQKFYTKYNKLERRLSITQEQLGDCKSEFTYLDSILVALEQAVTIEETDEIKQELISTGYLASQIKKRQSPSTPSFHPWRVMADGVEILIGKNNRQNDWLTFKESRPDDIWLHTKDVPGSHVIIRCGANQPSNEVLQIAAHYAALFSKARNSSQVPVDFTRRRFVKKPSGAKPGFVIYEKQQTIYITPDAIKLKNLMQT